MPDGLAAVEALDSELPARFARRLRVPAVATAIVDASGRLRASVVGTCRRGGSQRAVLDDPFHVGSCAKSITALLYARLVELGLASWGASVSSLFDDLAQDLHPGWADRSVDELFHCRAGVIANLSAERMNEAWRDERPLPEQRTSCARDVLSRPPGPRGRFVYSNVGYVLLGAGIDRLARATYERALERYLFDPLGVTSAAFGPPARVWGHPARVRLGNLCLLRGDAADPRLPQSDNPRVLSSAGTLHVSVADWARLVSPFLAGAATGLLRRQTVEHLLRPPQGKGPAMAMGWASAAMPGVSRGMQGSNTFWSATALMDERGERASLIACNDGRTRVLMQSPRLAQQLLAPN